MNNISEYRKRLGMTQYQLAQRIDACTETIKRWEREMHKPSYPTMMRLATILECTPFDLFPDLPKPEPPKPKNKELTSMVIIKNAHAPAKASACQFHLLGWCTANKQKAGDAPCAYGTNECPLVEVSVQRLADLLNMEKAGTRLIIEKSKTYPEVM